MYRLNDILNSFRGLVGWEQGFASDEKLKESLTTTASGLYFQEAHPLLTLRAMKAIAPEIEKYLPVWANTTTYKIGENVKSGTGANVTFWESKVNNNVGHTPEEGDYWTATTPLSIYLAKKTDAGIKTVITKFITDKVINMETRNIIDRRALFDGAGKLVDTISNTGKVCGFEIVPLRSGGISMKLEKVGLQFAGNVGSVKLYLFHSSSAEPVWSQTVNYDKTNGTFKWFDLADLYMSYINPNTNAGGSWYFVYNQRALPAYMEAINYARDWSREPCATCNRGDVQLYREMTKYVQVSPFCVDVPENWNELLWDIEDNVYMNTLNYGLNLQFSIGCDLTDLLIDQRSIFASVVQKQVASDCLRALALNPEVNVNRVQANAGRDNILYELDGNGQGIKGLQGELEKAYKSVSVDTKGLDRVCLCNHTGGVKFGAI